MKWGGESEVTSRKFGVPHEHSFADLFIEHQWRPNFGEIVNVYPHDAWQPLSKCRDAASLRPSSAPCPSCAPVTRLGLQLTLS